MPFLDALLAYAAIFGLIVAFLAFVRRNVDTSITRSISKTAMTAPATPGVSNLLQRFLGLLDAALGFRKRRVLFFDISAPSIARSAAFTLLFLIATNLVSLLIFNYYVCQVHYYYLRLPIFYGTFVVFFIVNFFMDYASHVQTRFVLAKFPPAISLLVDLAATLVVTFAFFYVAMYLAIVAGVWPSADGGMYLERLRPTFDQTLRVFETYIASLVLVPTYDDPFAETILPSLLGPYILTGFFSSIFLWLFLASRVAIRASKHVDAVRRGIRRVARPGPYRDFHALAISIVLICTVVYWLVWIGTVFLMPERTCPTLTA